MSYLHRSGNVCFECLRISVCVGKDLKELAGIFSVTTLVMQIMHRNLSR